jgi:uncharacterized protein (TIGR03000 family)
MPSFGLSLVPGVALLLLAVAPSEEVARPFRPIGRPFRPVIRPFRPMITPFRPGLRTFHPWRFNYLSRRLFFSRAYRWAYGGYGMNAMPYWGYGMYAMPYGGYGSSYAPALASQLPQAPTASDIEVSGPLDTPPPYRAVIRARLPQRQADVSFDGKKVDTMGRSRTYVTPELSGSRTFEVTATWTHNGRSRRVEKQVTVSAGQVRTLDFTKGK